jgi:hypothetical protein
VPGGGGVLFTAALLAAGLCSPPALAQMRASGDYLRRMDGSGDGRVSLAEYQAWMGYAFARMDRNGDDELSAAELPGGRGKPVSLAAHRESLAAAFRRQDANHDGQLDARELAAPPR